MNSTGSAWVPWTPTTDEPWNLRRVVHLHRRVGFATNWETLQRDLRDGHEAAIERLLHSVHNREFEQISNVIGDAATGNDSPNRLKAWWIYRMICSPDPLGERLALMWHNHFATSNLKVANIELMYRQNKLFREHGKGPFGGLIRRVARDPALLIWLDADANRKEHPNENLAREIMELFTLGVGHYTESDVRQAARALTGWSVREGQFCFIPDAHDDGEKTILGQTGNWTGDDLVDLLIEHPATATRLSYRLCELLLGENVATPTAIDELAVSLRQSNLNIGRAIETIVHSSLFFSDRNIGNRVLSPIEFIVGLVRSLEMVDVPPSTLLLAEWSDNLGQNLFYPPNVFGWPGGRSWLTTRSIVGRSNFVSALLDGTLFNPLRPIDLSSLAKRHGFAVEKLPVFLGQLIAGVDPTAPFIQHQQAKRQESSPLPRDLTAFEFLTSSEAILG